MFNNLFGLNLQNPHRNTDEKKEKKKRKEIGYPPKILHRDQQTQLK